MYPNMNNYSDLLDIDTLLPVTVVLEPLGQPRVTVIINDESLSYEVLPHRVTVTYYVPLMDSVTVQVQLQDKNYNSGQETAVIVQNILIDGIDVVPAYTHLAHYQNDHDYQEPTNYLGFNGQWTLTTKQPFYHWLHHVQAQGWLLT